MQVVVLASGSQYRAELLQRLGVPFQVISPDVDETVQQNEHPEMLARRLARQKALRAEQMLQQNRANGGSTTQHVIIIGSDQVACFDQQILGKPGSIANACDQLTAMSGQAVHFLTSVYMLHTASGRQFEALDVTVATLRSLKRDSIERYVSADQPLDCAGSFKVEALGISLFETISSQDPSALVGLPLISVCQGLRQFGVEVP